MTRPGTSAATATATRAAAPARPTPAATCCPRYHTAVELLGRRWNGAIVAVLLEYGGPLRFKELARAVPQISDRLLVERVRELERHGLMSRRERPGTNAVEYELTQMGRDLRPAVDALGAWARRWLD